MSPPISKDWWLAAALTGAALPTTMAQTQPAPGQQPGLITNYEAGKAPTTQTLYVTAASGQRVVTGPAQSAHVLFPDQSALTLGPNSEIIISKYEFDARSKSGNLAISMTKGLLRVVGGFVSKSNPIQVRTATATVGIRGGISSLSFDPDKNGGELQGAFLFGNEMRVVSEGVTEQRAQSELLDDVPLEMHAQGASPFSVFGLARPGSSFVMTPLVFNFFPPLQLPAFLQPLFGWFNNFSNLTPFGGFVVGPFGSISISPPDGDPNTLGPDRLPDSNNVGDPNQGGTPGGTTENPTLNQILGGNPSPGNQS